MNQGTAELIGSRPQRKSSVRWLALAGFVGQVIFWGVIFVLGALVPGYSHVSNFISELGAVNAPYAPVQRVNFGVIGVSVLALAIGLDRWNRMGWRHWIGVILLGLTGIGVISAGVFQADLANEQAMTNLYHGLSSLLAFLSALVGIPIVTWRLARDGQWPAYSHRLLPAGVAVLLIAGFVIFRLSTGTWWVGLGQRIYVALITIWLAYHSFTLYQLSTG